MLYINLRTTSAGARRSLYQNIYWKIFRRINESTNLPMTWILFAYHIPKKIGSSERTLSWRWGVCHIVTVRAEASQDMKPLNLDRATIIRQIIRIARGRHAWGSTKGNGMWKILLCAGHAGHAVLEMWGDPQSRWCHYPRALTASNCWCI